MYVYEEPRVYFVDELHRATDRIQDVLVTMLEEGRANYCFIFCTLHVERIEEPLLQRLISFKVTPPTTEEMVQRLKLICVREGWSRPDTMLTEIAEANHNVPRACENALFLESLT